MNLKSHKAIMTYYSHGCALVWLRQHFGVVRINEDYVSEIIDGVNINVRVSYELLDDFICFFFQPKIVLFEKFRNQEDCVEIKRVKKVWNDVTDGIEWVDAMPEYIEFRNMTVNSVMMNNGNCYSVPILRR